MGTQHLTLFVLLFLSISACADEITITEDDHTLFPLRLSDRDNHVIYAVHTNGACAITDIFPYWKMDDGDGHTEELLSWEEPLYGVENVHRKSDTVWTFTIARLPSKTVSATVLSLPTESEEDVACGFVGISILNDTEAIVEGVLVDNDGNTVHGLNIYGRTVSDSTPVTETVKP